MNIQREENSIYHYKVIIVDSNPDDVRFIKGSLEESENPSFDTISVNKVSDINNDITDQFDAILLGFHSATDSDDAISDIKRLYPEIPIILITDSDSEEAMLRYMDIGVYDCIAKNEVNMTQLVRYISCAIERFRKIKSLLQRLDQLKSVEETLRGIMEENTEPIVVVDANGIIRFVNQSAESLFGRGKEGLVGEMFEFSVNPDRTTEIEIVRSDNKKVFLEMRTTAIVWQKEIAYLIWLHNITGLVSIREELRGMYMIDELTGLFNQRAILMLGEQQLKISDRTKRGMLFINVRLANFSDINTSYGPYAVDEALADTAYILKDTFRKSDIIARFGDDEFIVLAVEASKGSDDIICSRFQHNIDIFNNKAKRKYKLSVHIKKFYYDPNSPSSFDNILSKLR